MYGCEWKRSDSKIARLSLGSAFCSDNQNLPGPVQSIRDVISRECPNEYILATDQELQYHSFEPQIKGLRIFGFNSFANKYENKII